MRQCALDRRPRRFYDADGSGAGEQFLLTKVKAGTKLHADDFFIGVGIAV
jgi:hypothetical protein